MMSEEKAEYMNSPVDELKPCPFCGGEANYEEVEKYSSVSWSVGCGDGDCIGFILMNSFGRKSEARAAWNTRAESPDSVDGEPARNHVWSADGETCINCGDKDWMGSKCSNAKNEMPPPPPVAEGELIKKVSDYMQKMNTHDVYRNSDDDDFRHNDGELYNLLDETLSALQSRSTPPPVAGGELIRRASLEATSLDLWASDLLQIAKSKCGEVCEADQCCKERYNAGQLDDAARMIRELIAALQHQDGVFISREDVDEIESLLDFVQQTWAENAGSQRVQARLDRIHGVIKQSLESKNGQ